MWHTIGRKRERSSRETNSSNKRQLNIKNYWLNKPVSTGNIYEKLSEIDEQELSTENCGNNLDKDETKSPPIYIDGVENIAPLKQVLDNIAKDQYALKILKNNQVRIQSYSSVKFHPIMEGLKLTETQGYI